MIFSCLIFESSVERGIPSWPPRPLAQQLFLRFQSRRFDELLFLILESHCQWTRQFQPGCLVAERPGRIDPKGVATA